MSNNQQIKTVTAKGASEFVKEDAELQKDGYIFCLPKTRGTSKVAKDQWREVMSSVCGEANSDGKGSLLKPSMFFGGGNAVACDKCGTEGLGWMMWGPFNTLPNIVALLTSSLPYTAAGHKFNTDLLAGLGPQPMYRYTQYVGGEV